MTYVRSSCVGRWFHIRMAPSLFLVALACATEAPLAPGPAVPPATPEGPVAPPSASPTLILSREDVVLNALAGRAASDSATISITTRAHLDLSGIQASIRYRNGEPGDWLSLDLAPSPSVVGLTLRARTAALAAGEYTATILLQVPGAPAESLAVIARVVTTASIGLNAAQICFTTTVGGPLPRKDDVRVTSVDGSVIDGLNATIMYDAGQPSGWLTATFDQPAAPARLWLQASNGQLPAGIYTATVLVASPGAGNSPVPIRVTLTIAEPAPAPSFIEVTIQWEGPDNGGLARVNGRFGIFCGTGLPEGGNCRGILDDGVGSTELVAEADWGARFVRWEGACSGQVPLCRVDITTPGTTIEVTAVFATRPATLGFLLTGSGASGTVTVSAPWTTPSGGPVTCRLVNGVMEQACDGILEGGVGTFTVTATADPGNVFVYWQIGSFLATPRCGAVTPSCTFTIAQGGEQFLGVVVFAPQTARAVRVEIEGPGYVSWQGDPYGADCPEICTLYFDPGTAVSLRAVPGEGASFIEWSGCPSPAGTTCEIPAAESMVVRARFQ